MNENGITYLLTYDHGGYILWKDHFIECLKNAIEWLEKYPSLKIGLDNETYAYDKYAETQPELIQYIKDMLEKYASRLGIGSCTYGQPLAVFINEESNVRQLVYAIRSNIQYFSKRPYVFAISEHGYHSQMPQLLVQTGYHAAIMRTHFMMYGYNPTYDIGFGTWKGEDGTAINAVPTYDNEGAAFGITTEDNWILTRWPGKTTQSLEDYTEKFSYISPLLASRYDDIVLRCEELVAHVEKNQEKYRWILLDEIPALFGKPQALFSPHANDFVVRMPWGYCGNKIFRECRLGEICVLQAERLHMLSWMYGGLKMQEQIDAAWKNLLAAQHHDVQICGLLDEESRLIHEALTNANQVQERALQFLSSQFVANDELSMMAINTNSFESKQELCCVITIPKSMECDEMSLWFGDDTEIPCEYEVMEQKNNHIRKAKIHFSDLIPPYTARVYSVSTNSGQCAKRIFPKPEFPNLIHAGDFKITLDEYGIRSIRNNDCVFFENEKGALFAGNINGKDEVSLGIWSVLSIGRTSQATYNGFVGSVGIEFTMMFVNERIDCRTRLEYHGEKIGATKPSTDFQHNVNGFIHENKLRFVLPISFSDKVVGIHDLPFMVSECSDSYIQGNYWTACCDGEKGVACFNKGDMCMTRESNGISIPLAYANTYVWGDRILYGTYTHEYSLLLFNGEWNANDLHRKALEYEYPIIISNCEPNQGGVWKKEKNLLCVQTTNNVIISALYQENDELYVRAYETEGKLGSLEIHSERASTAVVTNLLGEKQSKGEFDGEVQPHQIVTLKLS